MSLLSLDTATSALKTLLGVQHNRILTLSFPGKDGPDAQLLANQLSATECMSRDFEFVVEVLSDNARLELKDLIGKRVTLSLVREDGSLRYFNGHVFQFSLERVDGGQAYYKMVLRPWLSFLRHRVDHYLFHGLSLEAQLDAIFNDYPQRDWALRLTGDDAPMTFACQAGESDYNYIHRRLESRGWGYWYEHRKDGHTLVISDDTTQMCEPIDGDPIMVWQDEGGSQDDDGIARFTPVRHVASTQYSARSFDFKNPHPLSAEVPTLNQQGDLPAMEVYEYAGAYGFQNSGEGDALVKLRMEEIEAGAKRFEATGNERYAQPGRCFSLHGHFDFGGIGADSTDAEVLILDTYHHVTNNYEMAAHGSDSAPVYRNVFTCLRKKIPWRPSRGYNSVEPKLYGLQTATVVGPAGEEIYTDAYGRVRVQFHWDRIGAYNEKSSCWLRVATAWSGSSFGMTSIPRIGTEVIVQFLDGNPDRPLITGMVPNAETMPPWELPANKTQSGILTRSTPKGGYENANAIRFEDKKGQEELWLHAEKDQRIEVEHDESHWVGHDRAKTIDNDETVHVKHDRTETVDNNETITVHGNRTERVDHNETISIGDNRTEDVGQNETISIGANRTVTIGANKAETVAMAKAETIGMAKALTIGLGYQTSVGAAMNTTVGLSQSEQVGQNKSTHVGKTYSIEVGDELSITVGKASITLKADGTITINGHTLSVGTTAEQTFNADGEITVKGKQINEN